MQEWWRLVFRRDFHNYMQHKLLSSKTTCMTMQLLMQLIGEARVEICNNFNAIPARDTNIVLLIVLRNLATIVRNLITLSKNVLLVIRIVKLMLTKLWLTKLLLVIRLFLTNQPLLLKWFSR